MSKVTDLGKTGEDLNNITQHLRRLSTALEKNREALKEDLINMIVHDLRNPVTSTILRLDMIESDPDGRLTLSQEKSLQSAKSNMFKLSEMITNLLEISRFETCSVEVKKTAVNVKDLIEGIVKIHTASADLDRKTISVTVDSEAAVIACDKYLLERILSNIVSNAVKHSYSGGKILIRVLCAESEGIVLFRVQDFGEGIPSAYHQKIFERFFQVEMRQLGHRSDSGLGLAFCKMAVKALKGEISVESEPGKGSCFTFSLPEALMVRQTQPGM